MVLSYWFSTPSSQRMVVDVQVVGWLIQEQHVGFGKQGLRQQHAQFEAGGDFRHGGVVQLFGNAHAAQQFGGACFGGVAVVFGELGFQFGSFHVVVFGGFGVGVNCIALGHRRPHFGVPHQHHVQHAHVFIGKLVLAQFTQPHAVFNRHFAAGLLQIAAQNLHEGGFARTVRADEAVAVAFAEFDGYVFKQRLCAELHGDVVGGNHGIALSNREIKNRRIVA